MVFIGINQFLILVLLSQFCRHLVGVLLVTDPKIQLVRPCSRCVVTTIDQQTSCVPESGEPLTTLATFRKMPGGVMFGQNALVLSGIGAILAVNQKIKIIS